MMVSPFLGLLPLQIILVKVSLMMKYVWQKVGMVEWICGSWSSWFACVCVFVARWRTHGWIDTCSIHDTCTVTYSIALGSPKQILWSILPICLCGIATPKPFTIFLGPQGSDSRYDTTRWVNGCKISWKTARLTAPIRLKCSRTAATAGSAEKWGTRVWGRQVTVGTIVQHSWPAIYRWFTFSFQYRMLISTSYPGFPKDMWWYVLTCFWGFLTFSDGRWTVSRPQI